MSAIAQQQAVQPAPEGGILDRILTEGRLARAEHQIAGARTMLEGFVAEALHEGVQVDAGAKRAIAERIAALDRLIAAQVNEVLHHPKVQKLEASWRSLDKLVTENDLSSLMRVRVLNCHRKEIERDLARAPAFDQSHLFKSVYESEYGTLGGDALHVSRRRLRGRALAEGHRLRPAGRGGRRHGAHPALCGGGARSAGPRELRRA